jgi:hypothetical protein
MLNGASSTFFTNSDDATMIYPPETTRRWWTTMATTADARARPRSPAGGMVPVITRPPAPMVDDSRSRGQRRRGTDQRHPPPAQRDGEYGGVVNIESGAVDRRRDFDLGTINFNASGRRA